MEDKIINVMEKKNKLFWILQAVGWTTYWLSKSITSLMHGKDPIYFITALFYTLTGFFITLGLRYIYQYLRIKINRPAKLMLWLFILTLAGSALFSSMSTMIFQFTYKPQWSPTAWDYITHTISYFITLIAWSGLYFAINLQFMYQREKQKLIQAQAQAQQAQLQMLRYQLNPHFLFNTLNAISTLVLDEQNKNANHMLTKLSAFLRYSLVSQPLQKTSLNDEIYALSLYLDIEKIRFEDRLNLHYDISSEAATGLIPSLLLQPLVENAIKYAIAPSENGGKIAICGKVNLNRKKQKRLTINLVDDGPGIQHDTPNPLNKNSGGVGLKNTKARLEQVYPDNHSFVIADNHPKGVKITIDIPYETEKK